MLRGAKTFAIGAVFAVALSVNARTARAATCNVNADCSGDTPSCVSGTCVSCLTPTATCGLGLGGEACQPDGTCMTKCTADFGATTLGTACPANLPYCTTSTGVCGNCVSGVHACVASSIEPVCTVDVGNASVCGCTSTTQCTTGHCDTTSGLKGQCVTSCGDDNQCATTPTTAHCTVQDGGAGECVECVDSTTCGGGSVCDTTRHVCVFTDGGGINEPDAGRGLGGDGGTSGSGDDGGPGEGSGGDGGETDGGVGTGNGGDSGTTGTNGDGGGGTGISDGGSSANNPDATIREGYTSNGTPIYDYGHVEGGACSQSSGESNPGSLASSAFLGLAALAGILSIRTRRRASDGRSNVQNGKSQDKHR